MSDFDHQTPAAAFLVLWVGFGAAMFTTFAVFSFPSHVAVAAILMTGGIFLFVTYLVLLLDYITPQIGESRRPSGARHR